MKTIYTTQIDVNYREINRFVDTEKYKYFNDDDYVCFFEHGSYIIHAESETSAEQADFLAISHLIEIISKLSDCHKALGFDGNKLVVRDP
jgi:hypothetical protein